ncbi:hypothetical protein Leryth_011213 [Lithospermum erythrorhizon]|nr:hypothetical protein Leryth_011213 [Lithospermum erythrorhizon]
MENSMFSSQKSNESFDVIAWLRDFGEVNSTQENKHNFGMEEFESFYSSLCLSSNGQNIRQNEPDNVICQPMDTMNQGCYVQELSTTSSDPTMDSIDQWCYGPELGTTSIDPMKTFDSNQCGTKKVSDVSLRRDVNSESIPIADVLRLAGERYLQFSTRRLDGLSMFIHPYGSAFSELSLQETKEVELMHTLFLAADEVASCQYDVASELIGRCRSKASFTGNPVERLVLYFAESLQDRINSGTGRISPTRMNEIIQHAKGLGLLGDQPEFIAMQKCLPFSQVILMVGIQEIVENVKSASKIHLIDLEIRGGVQWILLIQALSQRKDTKLEVKITAVVTANREKIEATVKRLLSYAGSLNLPLSFKMLFASDMSEIKKEHFRTKADETVVVYGSSVLRSMISRPNCLDNLMKVIRSLNPSLMVVAEIEANHNSQSFLHRFVESLFFYGAVFDCLDDCMDRDDQLRLTLEGTQFGQGIQNTIATEGEQRVTRNVKLDVWRAFFRRFWMEEVELCESSIYQGNLIRKQYARGDSCSIERNGKGIIVGWKGTPILSLSTWKFLRFNPC